VQELELPPSPIQLSENNGKSAAETASSHAVVGSEPPGQTSLPLLLEGVLFVAAEPVQVARLAQLLDVSQEAVDIALADMGVAYRTQQRGVRLLRKGDRVQLTSAPEAAPYVERFLNLDLTSKLSPAALETLQTAVDARRHGGGARRQLRWRAAHTVGARVDRAGGPVGAARAPFPLRYDEPFPALHGAGEPRGSAALTRSSGIAPKGK
jgi:hypothetical protein